MTNLCKAYTLKLIEFQCWCSAGAFDNAKMANNDFPLIALEIVIAKKKISTFFYF